MNILETTLCGPLVETGQMNATWVYANGDRLTGLRWCFLDMGPNNGVYVSCMIGNPVDDFEILEVFRPVTEPEQHLLKMINEKTKGFRYAQ